MATEEEYERWQAGEATINEVATDAVRLLGKLIGEHPEWTRCERYAAAFSIFSTTVPEPLRDQLFDLIRAGA